MESRFDSRSYCCLPLGERSSHVHSITSKNLGILVWRLRPSSRMELHPNKITPRDACAESNMLQATPPTLPRSSDSAESIQMFPNARYRRLSGFIQTPHPHAARVLLPLINIRRLGAAHNILVSTRPFSCTNVIFHKWVRRVGASRL